MVIGPLVNVKRMLDKAYSTTKVTRVTTEEKRREISPLFNFRYFSEFENSSG